MKKEFFRTRTAAAIEKLEVENVDTPEGLVDRIEGLDSGKQGLILDFRFVHPEFENRNRETHYISRQTMRGFKRGRDGLRIPSYLELDQPRTIIEALNSNKRPLDIRNEALMSMAGISEEENFNVGYMYRPILEGVRSPAPVLCSFWALMDGAKLDAYTERVCKKLPGEFINAGAFVKKIYGPNIFVNVPSKTRNSPPYSQRWANVATRDVDEKKALAWNTSPIYGEFGSDGTFFVRYDKAPKHGFMNVGNNSQDGYGLSFDFTPVFPQDVAGHQTILRYFMKKRNEIPIENSQYGIPSCNDAAFWNKVENNVLIIEETLDGRVVVKPLRIDQKSMVMARYIGKHIMDEGVQSTMYWDAKRDGKISGYPWLAGEE